MEIDLYTSLSQFFQLFLALALGMVIGVERSIAGKTAGMRTYALVSLGACLFILISVYVSEMYIGVVSFDPMRTAAAVIMGVGFLAGGLIVFRDAKINGLTTAAGLWVATGVGMAVGFKLYVMAILATLLTIAIFTVLWVLEDKVKLFAYGPTHSNGENSGN